MQPGVDNAFRRCVITLALAAAAWPVPVARADPPAFSQAAVGGFFQSLWPAARAQGISRRTFELATAGLVPDPAVIERAISQPEHVKTPGDYLAALVTPERIRVGRQLATAHAVLLGAIEAAYGVDRNVVLAIWGVESAYGTETGSHSIVRSLATLAMADARRADFWRAELISAMRIIQDGNATPASLLGSWAGAMGQTQFIPTTYSRYAVDFDRDGRRDIWHSAADALASTANYLHRSGWVRGLPWGFEVVLPRGFDYRWSEAGRTQALAEWLAAGVQIPFSAGTSSLGQPLELVLPAGAQGPAFLVTRNFRAILRYNQSIAYALAVGHLADRIAGAPALASPWPGFRPLARSECKELQRLLEARGLEVGEVDGIIGNQTKAAIRATQRALDLAEDGYPSPQLLDRLRAASAR